MIDDFLAGIQILNRHHGAEYSPLTVDRRTVYDLRPAKLILQLENAALNMALPFLGRMVFRVLLQISVAAGHLNGLDHLKTVNPLQTQQLFAQTGMTVF